VIKWRLITYYYELLFYILILREDATNLKNIICFLLVFGFLLTLSSHDITAQIKPKEYKITNSIHFSQKDLKYEDKNPFQAGIASFIVPGLALGQLYNGRYDKFAIHIGISAGIVGITSILLSEYPVNLDMEGNRRGDVGMTIFLSAALLYLGNWIYSIVDSVVTANNINKRNEYLNKARTQFDKFELGFATNEQKKLQVKLKLNL